MGRHGSVSYSYASFASNQKTVKPEMVMLAIMCTAYEKSITRSSWKHAIEEHRFYLRQLEE